jgi:hypothetical protein
VASLCGSGQVGKVGSRPGAGKDRKRWGELIALRRHMHPSGKMMERVAEKRGMAFEFTLLFIRGRDAGNARFPRDSSEIGPRLKRDGRMI